MMKLTHEELLNSVACIPTIEIIEEASDDLTYEILQSLDIVETEDKKNKQHSYQDPENEEKYKNHIKKIKEKLDEVIDLYHEGVEMGLAKEMARYCLPMGTWTELVFQADANNLIKFFHYQFEECWYFSRQFSCQSLFIRQGHVFVQRTI